MITSKAYLGRVIFIWVFLASVCLSAAELPFGAPTALQAAGTLVDVSIALSNDTVGTTADLTLSFKLLGEQLPPGATVQIAFPPEFDKAAIDSVAYLDSDEGNEDYQVLTWEAANDIVTIELDTLGTPAGEDAQLSITMFGIGNAETVNSYRLALAVLDSLDSWLAVPVWTPQFSLKPGPVADFTLDPSGIISVNAGDLVHFTVSAEDAFGNVVTLSAGLIQWNLVQSPPGAQPVVEGRFEAKIAGSYRLQAVYGLFTEQCIIYVLPGPISQLRMTGGSSGALAGIPWSDSQNDVTVSAHDIFGNLITDFEGEVYFTCTDSEADLPATSGAPFTFALDDQGKRIFDGSSFTFYTA
ncbi:MAG: hypothetical protein ABIJ61_14020, partial [bacterium]